MVLRTMPCLLRCPSLAMRSNNLPRSEQSRQHLSEHGLEGAGGGRQLPGQQKGDKLVNWRSSANL